MAISSQESWAAATLTKEMPIESTKKSGTSRLLRSLYLTTQGSMLGSIKRGFLEAYHHNQDKASPAIRAMRPMILPHLSAVRVATIDLNARLYPRRWRSVS